jgi:uncharacterized OB-fold protein
MSLNRCSDCTTAYAVGLEACPHCGSTDISSQDASQYATPAADVVEVTPEGDPTTEEPVTSDPYDLRHG